MVRKTNLKAKEKKFESHNKVCKNKDPCRIKMPSEDSKILEVNRYQKSEVTIYQLYSY